MSMTRSSLRASTRTICRTKLSRRTGDLTST
uniref:Uncharacterized protein n=1 Tax=Arundo donax TaxID=35708 RepID=A0A0A8Y8V4_ARUDO